MQISVSKAGKKYRALTVDIKNANLALYYRDENKEPFRSFDQLDKWLSAKNQRLVFATNAGMFGKGFFPLGLHIEQGHVLQNMHLPKPGNNVDADAVVGNFDLPHNGVFSVREGKASVVETQKLAGVQDWSGVQLATQSGPMLLIDGAINPSFNENSGNLKIRSGVGIIDDNNIVFAISDDPISFYDFALVFKEQFNCGNALFLDGAISKMYIYESDNDNIDESIFAGMLAITVAK
ncbi:MAG TPA: phosphodiester glycosidase family protein [Pyrinomonadaceae bacterium]|nr:phosphodiester glycosidase family protein [Pyrinomonadaceae bacterium]